MFYHGGMTLGYLVPPVKKDKAETKGRRGERAHDDESESREREMATPFLTPWHLFY